MTKKKPVVILFYDTTAASIAMSQVFNAVSALSELKGFAFFTGDSEKLNVGHFMRLDVLNLTHTAPLQEIATELRFNEVSQIFFDVAVTC